MSNSGIVTVPVEASTAGAKPDVAVHLGEIVDDLEPASEPVESVQLQAESKRAILSPNSRQLLDR